MRYEIPPSLRTWFLIHFVVDMLFGIPLLLFPAWTLSLFGLAAGEPLTARLVGAALLGIGGISVLARDAEPETYRHLLTMKLIWSGSAIVGIVLSIVEGAPSTAWLFLATFAVFFSVWVYYWVRLNGSKPEVRP